MRCREQEEETTTKWRQRKLQAEQEKQFVMKEAQKERTSFWKEQWQKLAVICETPDQLIGWEECTAIFKNIAEPYKTKITLSMQVILQS